MVFFPNLSLTKQIASFLEQQIIVGKLSAHERIQEIKYATELNVSRNSLREALIVLERRHLITMTPRKGAVVKPVDLHDIESVFDLMTHLYVLLAMKLARKWRGDECARFFAAAEHVEALANASNREEFFKAALAFPELGFPIVKNHYLENSILDMQPACARMFYRLVSINKEVMLAYARFLTELSQAIFERDTEIITLSITRFSRRIRWQIFLQLRAQERQLEEVPSTITKMH